MATFTGQEMEELALKLIDKFNADELWFHCWIYVNGKRFWANTYLPEEHEKRITENGAVYYVENDVDVEDYLDCFCNPDTLSVTFEGPLYHKINYEDFDYIFNLSDEILKPYGLYFEQGYAWSMSAY